MLHRPRLAPHDLASERKQADRPAGVVPIDRPQRLAHLDDNLEFFVQLPGQRDFRRLAGVDLAARELPEAAEVLARGAQAGEELAAGIFDHSADDVDHIG